MRVPHATSSAALVRHKLSADLLKHGIAQESIDAIVLVASELIGNAVRHTPAVEGDALGVDWELDRDGVTLAVCDASADPPTASTASVTETSGRGLQIVAALADDWGVRRLRSGKRVWARVHVNRIATRGA